MPTVSSKDYSRSYKCREVLTFVNFHVCFEVSALSKTSSTYETLVWPFARVNDQVSPQSAAVGEHSATGQTVVALDPAWPPVLNILP